MNGVERIVFPEPEAVVRAGMIERQRCRSEEHEWEIARNCLNPRWMFSRMA